MEALPSQAELLEELRTSLTACKPYFADPAVTRLADQAREKQKEDRKRG